MSSRSRSNTPETSDASVVNLATIRVLNNALVKRLENFGQIGNLFGTNRNIYDSLGWPKTPTFQTYWPQYKRNGVARRVVEAPVRDSWRLKPEILDRGDPEEESAFEVDWKRLVRRTRLWHYIIRADILAGIDQYAILYLGLTDDLTIRNPVLSNSAQLSFMQAFSNDSAPVTSVAMGRVDDPLFGWPEIYEVRFEPISGKQSRSFSVHADRVIHIADNTTSNDVAGSSRMEPVLNNLIQLEMIWGASGEGYWREAIPKLNFKADSEADIGTLNTSDVTDAIENFIHNLTPYLKLQGIDVQSIAPQLSDPEPHFNVQLRVISASTGIPQRILTGTERGELASQQDEKAWLRKMNDRREDYNEPVVLRPLIDKLIRFGVLPEPEGGEYDVEWPTLQETDEAARVANIKTLTEAFVAYANSPTAESMLPLEIYLSEIYGLEQKLVKKIVEAVEDMAADEAEAIRRDKTMLETEDADV